MFDFDKPGTEPPEHEVGIEFHRTGIDLIRQLVSQAVPATPRPPSAGGSDDGREGGGDGSRDGGGGGDGETQPETASPPLPAPPPIPRLEVAAFLVAERARPTSDPEIESSIRHDDGEVVRPQDGSALDAAGESSVPVEKEPTGAGRTEHESSNGLPASGKNAARHAGERPGPEPASSRAVSSQVTSPPETTARNVPPVRKAEQPEDGSGPGPGPEYDTVLGTTGASPQYGLFGRTSGRKIALDLNQTHTISLFGVHEIGSTPLQCRVVGAATTGAHGAADLPPLRPTGSPAATKYTRPATPATDPCLSRPARSRKARAVVLFRWMFPVSPDNSRVILTTVQIGRIFPTWQLRRATLRLKWPVISNARWCS